MTELPLAGTFKNRLSKNGTDLSDLTITKGVDQRKLFPALFLYELMTVHLSICAQVLGQV